MDTLAHHRPLPCLASCPLDASSPPPHLYDAQKRATNFQIPPTAAQAPLRTTGQDHASLGPHLPTKPSARVLVMPSCPRPQEHTCCQVGLVDLGRQGTPLSGEPW